MTEMTQEITPVFVMTHHIINSDTKNINFLSNTPPKNEIQDFEPPSGQGLRMCENIRVTAPGL